MKNTTKEYIADIVIYTMLYTPLIVPVSVIRYKIYKSGFVQVYNEAIQRNADINKDVIITPKEEYTIKRTILDDINNLKRNGKSLENIIDFLKNK